MMARDSAETPPPNMLSGETMAMLRDVVARFLDDESRADGELHGILHRVAGEAHEKRMRAEELVVVFKSVLDGLPLGATPHEKMRRARARERLVSLCIRAYYGEE